MRRSFVGCDNVFAPSRRSPSHVKWDYGLNKKQSSPDCGGMTPLSIHRPFASRPRNTLPRPFHVPPANPKR
jgi:hypothetical protein